MSDITPFAPSNAIIVNPMAFAMPKNIFVSAITVSSVAVKHKPTKTNKTAYKDAIAIAIKFFLVI